MVKLVWDADTKREYSSGVDRGVLYPKNLKSEGYEKGQAWNGLVKVGESPEGGDTTSKYANNNTYLNMISREIFKGSIDAFTYPPAFAECDGTAQVMSQGKAIGAKVTGQTRRPFGLSYRTGLGNDTEGLDYGYELHLVYNATAAVSARDFETINENPDAITFSWNFSTLPVAVPGFKPSSHIIVDSRTTDPGKLKELEKKLYGDDSTEPTLPSPEEVFTILGWQG